MWNQLRTALLVLLAFSILTGLGYPLAVTAIAQIVFPRQANGSLIERDGRIVGSERIGQPFAGKGYFWSRPSSTSPPYHAAASSGSNLGPTNPALAARVASTVAALRAAHGDGPVPVDLATASASGLDPHITLAAARYQAARVARERGLAVEAVRRLIDDHAEGRDLGLLGEPRVHLLRLNLALDALPGTLASGR